MQQALESLINGQHKQALCQIKKYGKNRFLYELALAFEGGEVDKNQFVKLVKLATGNAFTRKG